MEIKKNKEFEGYGIIANQLIRLNKLFTRIARYFFNKSQDYKFKQYKLLFGEREDDIYIASYPKSGTTVMQMILYHLTSDGRMDFKHIYEVSPWIRNASFIGEKPLKMSAPRVIKTHDNYSFFDKMIKGRFIYIYRNGMDVAVSHFHQQKNYNNQNLTFEKYLIQFFKQKKWFKHVRDWTRNRNKLAIIYVKYEDLLENKEKEIKRIIDFLGISFNQKAINRALKFSSFEWMKKNETLFGEKNKVQKKTYDQFIRNGKSGEGKIMFDEEQQIRFQNIYNKIIEKNK